MKNFRAPLQFSLQSAVSRYVATPAGQPSCRIRPGSAEPTGKLAATTGHDRPVSGSVCDSFRYSRPVLPGYPLTSCTLAGVGWGGHP
jgi:hypothetical protein